MKDDPSVDAKHILAGRAAKVEKYIAENIAGFPGAPARSRDSMAYSLNAGGKRIRPVLCLSFASLFGGDETKILPFAAAIEMIHTYSLIHDDLPAMDDDDFRRGRPSNHKAFGEAAAILAGDGLLTDAFWRMTLTDAAPEKLLSAIAAFARAAGSAGMVGGQCLDMELTGATDATLESVEYMEALKTGAIIEASCVCGAILGGADEAGEARAAEYGRALGKSFQIVDDILDVVGDAGTMGKPRGSDAAAGKNTWPSLAGLDASARAAREESARAKDALAGFAGADADFLRALADYVVKRVK